MSYISVESSPNSKMSPSSSKRTRIGFSTLGTFGAADIFYAPVVSRFITYGFGVPGFADSYMQAVWTHDWLQQWIAAAEDEQWVIEQYESVPAA